MIQVNVPPQWNTVLKRRWQMHSSKTNKMQRYTMVLITINALHVSGRSSAHHQELKTVYTASGICRAFSASYRYRELELVCMCYYSNSTCKPVPTHDSDKKQKKLDKCPMLCIQF